MSTSTVLELETHAPTGTPEEPLYEIVAGERVEVPPMSIYASLVAAELHFCLRLFLATNRLGIAVIESLLIFDHEANLRRRPDVAFVSAERWPLDREIPETGDWDVIPTIAVEVISPNETLRDVMEKMQEYFRHGVEEVWHVHPESRTVYRYESPLEVKIFGSDDQLVSTRLPGFSCPLVDLFRRTAGGSQAGTASTTK